MEIKKLDMGKYLGRSIRLLMNNDEMEQFKPLHFLKSRVSEEKDMWVGVNTEGHNVKMFRKDFQAVIK